VAKVTFLPILQSPSLITNPIKIYCDIIKLGMNRGEFGEKSGIALFSHPDKTWFLQV
jgi:hypothetical protein